MLEATPLQRFTENTPTFEKSCALASVLNDAVMVEKCVVSFSLRSLRICPQGCQHRSMPITLIPPPFQPTRAGLGDMY